MRGLDAGRADWGREKRPLSQKSNRFLPAPLTRGAYFLGAFFLVFSKILWYSKRKVLTPKYCIAVKDQYMSYSTFP